MANEPAATVVTPVDAVGVVQPPAIPASTGQAAPLGAAWELGKLEGRTTQIERQLQDLDNGIDNVEIGIGVLTFALASSAAYAVVWVKKQISTRIGKTVDSLASTSNAALESQLAALIQRVETAAQLKTAEAITAVKEAYFRFARILSLVEMKKYDAALIAGGVIEVPQEAHKLYPEEVQAALIKALCRSRIRHAGEIAWRWATELAQNRTKTALRCVLESAGKLSREEDAIHMYDSVAPDLSAADRLELEPMLLVLLRRARDPQRKAEYESRLAEITKKHEESEDVSVIVNIAAIYRDWGLLDHADSILRAALDQVRDAMEGPWDDAYSRLLTTYIANCVDRNEPQKAVDAAKLLLARSNRPDQVFACIRVAWRLPVGHEARIFFAEATLNRQKDGYLPNNDDGTWKSVAMAHEIMGRSAECDQILTDQIVRLSEETPSNVVRRFIYFLRCSIAEIQMQRGTPESVSAALKHLLVARESDNRGEASFLLATAYARTGDIPSCKE